MAWYLISEIKFTFTFNVSQTISKSGNIIYAVLPEDRWQYMTKILVISFEQYAPRKRENLKEENIICMLESANEIIHLHVHHRTTHKYIFKVKVFLSQKFLSPTIQTNVWGRKIQDLYNDRYLKIFILVLLFFWVWRGGCRGWMIIFFVTIT